MLPSLVLRVGREDSGYSRNDHNSFWSHRVLRDIPRHSRQRWRSIRRRRRCARLRSVHRHLPAPPAIVVAMPGMPRSVRLAMPCSLALLGAAGSLPVSDAYVRLKPSSAYRTRTLLAHSARDHRRLRAPLAAHRSLVGPRARRQPPSRPILSVGHFSQADPGHFWRASKIAERRRRADRRDASACKLDVVWRRARGQVDAGDRGDRVRPRTRRVRRDVSAPREPNLGDKRGRIRRIDAWGEIADARADRRRPGARLRPAAAIAGAAPPCGPGRRPRLLVPLESARSYCSWNRRSA